MAPLITSFCRGESGWQPVPVQLGESLAVELELFVCSGVRSGPAVLVVGGIHGDEYEGPGAISQLASNLSPDRICGCVVLLPVANPLAFEAGTRTSAVDGLNLARVFPGRAEGSPTQRLAQFLFSEFAAQSDYLIDLHSGGVEYEFLPVAGFYGKPEGSNPSFSAARAMRIPSLWQLPETDGVLSREVTRIGKTAVGAEYLGGGRLSSEGVRQYMEGIQSCLTHWGMSQDEVHDSEVEPRIYGNDWLLAPATGLFRSFLSLGEQVRRGDKLARIDNRRGQETGNILAENDGIVLGLRSKAYIRKGDWAVLVGKELESEG